MQCGGQLSFPWRSIQESPAGDDAHHGDMRVRAAALGDALRQGTTEGGYLSKAFLDEYASQIWYEAFHSDWHNVASEMLLMTFAVAPFLSGGQTPLSGKVWNTQQNIEIDFPLLCVEHRMLLRNVPASSPRMGFRKREHGCTCV
jgi:hypothetical protein